MALIQTLEAFLMEVTIIMAVPLEVQDLMVIPAQRVMELAAAHHVLVEENGVEAMGDFMIVVCVTVVELVMAVMVVVEYDKTEINRRVLDSSPKTVWIPLRLPHFIIN